MRTALSAVPPYACFFPRDFKTLTTDCAKGGFLVKTSFTNFSRHSVVWMARKKSVNITVISFQAFGQSAINLGNEQFDCGSDFCYASTQVKALNLYCILNRINRRSGSVFDMLCSCSLIGVCFRQCFDVHEVLTSEE